MKLRTCTKCKVAKPHDDFNKLTGYRDGLHPNCRECYLAHRNRYRAQPDVKKREREREIAYVSQPEIAELRRQRGREHKRKIRATEEGRRKNAETVKRWRERNAEVSRQRLRLANQKRKAAKLGQESRIVTTKDAARILNSACVNCGDRDKIQIDHIIPLSRGGRHAIGNLQPLCSFCNLSKNNSLQIEWKQRQMQEAARAE